MAIDRSDCISITDKTFDLSLEDSTSFTYAGPDQHVNTETLLKPITDEDDDMSATQIGSDTHTSTKQYHTTHDAGVIKHGHHVQRSRLGEQSAASNLITSIEILSRICESEKVNMIKDGDMGQMALNLVKLSENCELKLMFYEKNYKFLEGLYDSLNKEHMAIKKELSLKDDEIRELKLKYREMERINHVSKADLHHNQQSALGHTRRSNSTVKEIELNEVIERQQREIKEYKRFIKEIMDRE